MSTKPAKRSRKYFTPAEANAALPLVQAIVRDIADLAQDLRERQERLHGLLKSERGALGEAYREELKPIQEELERKKERLMECAKELENLGVELKDPNTGLVDFPAMMDGHEVYLCWRLGEVFIHLMLGKMIRPSRPDADKLTIYECGEPTIGSAWIQFDLRYYVVALLFVIFDVEVAFFFPWAVVFGQANALAKEDLSADKPTPQVEMARRELLGGVTTPQNDAEKVSTKQAASRFVVIALCDILVFFGVLLVGFAYLWKRGDLSWVRSTAMERTIASPPYDDTAPAEESASEILAAAGKH